MMTLTNVISLLEAREAPCPGSGAAGDLRVEAKKDPLEEEFL